MSISRSDRDALIRVLKMRAGVAKTEAEQIARERLADFEAQLAAQHKANAPAWAEITAQAQKAVSEADAEIARRCRDLGIPEEFRPFLQLNWAARGENADKIRRGELRKVATTRIDSNKAKALAWIERQHTELATQVVAGSLESGEAKAFLDALPGMEHLMPPVALADIQAAKPIDAARMARIERYGEHLADKYPDMQ